MFAILGWDKEEMMKYHAQAFTVMKICQLLCTVFKDAKQMEPQRRLTQVPTCFNYTTTWEISAFDWLWAVVVFQLEYWIVFQFEVRVKITKPLRVVV